MKYDEDEGLILLKLIGRLTAEDHRHATDEAIRLAKRHDTWRFLEDNTLMDNRASLIDLHLLAARYDAARIPRTTRIAVVMPPQASERDRWVFTHYETVCCNRGYDVRLFDDAHDAREWLNGD
jgi:hypothetical protein